MSDNTQDQGRTLFTERAFTFTPRAPNQTPWGPQVGDDPIRAQLRWEMELQRQLYKGDVTHDPVAKAAKMDAMNPAPQPTVVPAPAPAPSAPGPVPSPAPALPSSPPAGP